ncbi:MAG TPA: DHH family phosphoesterase [Patescibacteria group bacterium]|nr:DHH family phosphoesterase [Patescibacteria group bacterium]
MMKIIVTHKASDLDAIGSSWMIKRFLPGWENAEVRFVPAGNKLAGKYIILNEIIEKVAFDDGEEAEVIHVDTGMRSLDHHQIASDDVCSTSIALNYVLEHNEDLVKDKTKVAALKRISEYAVNDDHFQEVFLPDPTSDIYSFSIVSLIHGIKLIYPKDDASVFAFGSDALDSVYHFLENQIWAENEISEKGIRFDTKWGKSLAIETHNDSVMKVGQTQGYALTVRKDPSTGNVRIKSRPKMRKGNSEMLGIKTKLEDIDVDLTPIYEKLKKMDPDATWFLHISKRMLLNGSSKNPTMKGSKLTLEEVVEMLQNT